jgi:hypothetical protein
MLILVSVLILTGCSSKPDVRHIPMTQFVEGIVTGTNAGKVILKTGSENVEIPLSSKLQQQIQSYPLKQGSSVKVKCVIYDEGNGKSKRIAEEITDIRN